MATFKENLAADFDIFTDDLSIDVTYKRKTSETFNSTTGKYTPSYASGLVVTVVRQAMSRRLVAVGGGLYQPDDLVLIVKAEDLPVTPGWTEPNREDQITYGGGTYEIREVVLEEDENVYRFVVRRL